MANLNPQARKKEFQKRGGPLDTMITTDTYRLLLTEDSLIAISNHISKLIGRKLTTGDIDELTKYCARVPESKYYQLTLGECQKAVAKDFVNRKKAAARTVTEETDNYLISGVAEDTDRGTISDYARKELSQFTPDENQFKFTAFANRRGNAVIDEMRVAGERSSPDNIAPISGLQADVLNKEIFKMAKAVQSFMAPDAVEKMFTRIQTGTLDYDSVNLPHQMIQFDSRNRLPNTNNYNSSDYSWNLNPAGQPGQIGNVWLQDTLQQIIRMRLYPFWAPVNASALNPYRKIRMLIREYVAQSTQVLEYNDPTASAPILEQYHFELEVDQIQGDRMFLVPVESAFRFRKPMAKNLDSFTVHFRTPFLDQVFDADSGVFTITYGNPTLFTITSPASFNLTTGDLIYVYNSASGVAAIDNEINRPGGQIITKLSNTQFTISVDSSSLSGTQTKINVYFGSKRLFFQMEFTSLEQ